MQEKKKLLERIVIDPRIMLGKPVIRGSRLTVQHVLGLLAEGMTADEILKEYAHLTRDDIFACFVFAQQALENTTFAPLIIKT